MNEQSSLDLSLDLFRLIKQFPYLKFNPQVIDGLTRSEVGLLLAIWINHNAEQAAFSASEISNLLQITPAGVTHLVNPLERKGYIERLHDANDRRVVRLRLSEKGAQATAGIVADIRQQIAGLMRHLGEEEGGTFVRLLVKTMDYFASQAGS